MRLWRWELGKQNPEKSRIKHGLCYLNLLFIFNGVITGTAQPEPPGSTLSKERECVSQLTSGQQDTGEKATKIDHIFSLHT